MQDYWICYNIKIIFSQIAKSWIWNLRHPFNMTHDRYDREKWHYLVHIRQPTKYLHMKGGGWLKVDHYQISKKLILIFNLRKVAEDKEEIEKARRKFLSAWKFLVDTHNNSQICTLCTIRFLEKTQNNSEISTFCTARSMVILTANY